MMISVKYCRMDDETYSLPSKLDKSDQPLITSDKNSRVISGLAKKSPINAKELYLSKSRYVPGKR
jgi:hypothetical protein